MRFGQLRLYIVFWGKSMNFKQIGNNWNFRPYFAGLLTVIYSQYTKNG